MVCTKTWNSLIKGGLFRNPVRQPMVQARRGIPYMYLCKL